MEEEKKTRIQVTKKLTEALKDLGKKGETYEDVIWRLIEKTEEEDTDRQGPQPNGGV